MQKKQTDNRRKLLFAIFALLVILAMLAGDILTVMAPAP